MSFVKLSRRYSLHGRTSFLKSQLLLSQEIPCVVWNPEVHYRVYKSLLCFPILSQISPVHNLPLYFLKVYFNIILPSTTRCSKWSLSLSLCLSVCLRFSHQNRMCTFQRSMVSFSKNARSNILVGIKFMYSGNQEIYCIFKACCIMCVLFSTK